MAQSSIEWTMKVWNPTTSCDKVSQGCKNCYAEVMHRRLMKMQPEKYSRPFLGGAYLHEPSLPIPFKWKKGATIFVNSMSDLFHKNLSIEDIAKVYAVMFLTPQHTYQILTKRPERRLEVFNTNEFYYHLWKYANQYHDKYIKHLEGEMYYQTEIISLFPFNNIWEGTSAEDQKTANQRIPFLLQTKAKIKWISAEPLLEEINMFELNKVCYEQGLDLNRLDWLVCGGESGHRKRPFDADWARTIRDYCKVTGINFFMKQMDKVQPIPEDLMIRQYPKIKATA